MASSEGIRANIHNLEVARSLAKRPLERRHLDKQIEEAKEELSTALEAEQRGAIVQQAVQKATRGWID